MVELDDRLETNARTLEAPRRAVEVTREHVKLLERDSPSIRIESSSPVGRRPCVGMLNSR
jgi:hypothetical protein